jgi:tRNA U34 5-methylaminomethyl-2-thiouridine-forming methyltransferase MnmC
MNTDKFKVIKTSDGSSSVFDLHFKENFHSTHGAIAESMHVYIKNGLKLIDSDKIKILEIGFGTGLNCFLTVLNKGVNQEVIYHTIEKFPLNNEHISLLNYSTQLNITSDLFEKISNIEWGIERDVADNFYLKKIKIDLLEFHSEELYDIIYFDAFSPNTQPELWTTEIFTKMFYNLKTNGFLTTYSAKGDVKRSLRNAGFEVVRIAGPIGKRHILKAMKR